MYTSLRTLRLPCPDKFAFETHSMHYRLRGHCMAAGTPRLAIVRSLGLLHAGTGRGMATRAPLGASIIETAGTTLGGACRYQTVGGEVLAACGSVCSDMSHLQSSKYICDIFIGLQE